MDPTHSCSSEPISASLLAPLFLVLNVQVRGRKALVLESNFAAPLSLLVEASTLREHGVEL